MLSPFVAEDIPESARPAAAALLATRKPRVHSTAPLNAWEAVLLLDIPDEWFPITADGCFAVVAGA